MNVNQISDSDIASEFQRRFASGSGDFIRESEELITYIRAEVVKNDRFREQFYVLYLNGRNEVIDIELLFTGTLLTSAVYPREVVRKVLNNGAAAIILIHNHPSGNMNPSKDDMRITKHLQEACALFEVPIHDHMIITATSYYSFADHGLI